ncbi:MAG: TonB-dependent receptor [Porticoccaceae bacterium]|nr:MAG: TonB-dependent receptor [Porticoccaceae bacterium]
MTHSHPNRIGCSPQAPRRPLAAAVAGALLALGSASATAQGQGASVELEEIVVTGTLIRGVEPTGKPVIAIDREALLESGARSANELLGELPQVSNYFNQRPEQDPRGAGRNTLNRPNLRNLPGINDTSGALTLVLVDGHRMTPMGVKQSSFDPDFLPAAAIERVEVVTDGGSALYGADAVGGVINFITRREFEGVELDLNYDFGPAGYEATDLSAIAGTSWEGGSAYLAAQTYARDPVFNDDLDWAPIGQWNAEGTVLSPTHTECIAPVGTLTTYGYAGPFGWVVSPFFPGTGTQTLGSPCDDNPFSTYLPELDRDHLFGSLSQEIGEGITLDLKGYWAEKTLTLFGYPRGDTFTGPNPNDLGLTPETNGGSIFYTQPSVGFSYGAHPAYEDRHEKIAIETWGFTPELTLELHGGWQMRNVLHYGRSDSSHSAPGIDRELQSEAIAAGLLDPADVAGADAELVRSILDRQAYEESIQELFLFRSVADGPLFALPAGEVRGAFGLELYEDRARLRQGDVPFGGEGSLPYREDSRDLQALFGELSIPLHATLELSAALRYDDYSDFGDTTNPTLGFAWRPLPSLEIHGHWSESYNAPTVLDRLVLGRIIDYFPGLAFIIPDLGQRDPARNDALLAEGAGGALKPQTAEIWTFGFQFEPLENLTVAADYYEIDFHDLLGAVDPQSPEAVRLNPERFIFNPTQEELDAFLAQMENGAEFADIDVAKLGVIVDRRIANTDEAKLKGIDLAVSGVHDTPYGTLDWRLAANHQLDFVLVQSGREVNQLEANVSDLAVAAALGWRRDAWRARLDFRYTAGFNTDFAVNQGSVDDFLVTDLFVAYEVPSLGFWSEGLTLRLNVENLFDEEPPTWRRSGQPNYANWTLGRVFRLGLSKRF